MTPTVDMIPIAINHTRNKWINIQIKQLLKTYHLFSDYSDEVKDQPHGVTKVDERSESLTGKQDEHLDKKELFDGEVRSKSKDFGLANHINDFKETTDSKEKKHLECHLPVKDEPLINDEHCKGKEETVIDRKKSENKDTNEDSKQNEEKEDRENDKKEKEDYHKALRQPVQHRDPPITFEDFVRWYNKFKVHKINAHKPDNDKTEILERTGQQGQAGQPEQSGTQGEASKRGQQELLGKVSKLINKLPIDVLVHLLQNILNQLSSKAHGKAHNKANFRMPFSDSHFRHGKILNNVNGACDHVVHNVEHEIEHVHNVLNVQTGENTNAEQLCGEK